MFLCSTVTIHLYAQSATKALNGVQYTIIDPATFAFNADSGDIKVGENYVIEGQVTMTSGASLYIKDISKTRFVLNAPIKLSYGTNVTAYVKIVEANQFSIKADIVKLEGPDLPAVAATNETATKSLDGVSYTVINPVTFSFNLDNGNIKVGANYVIEGLIYSTTNTSLYIIDIPKTTFILDSPIKIDNGASVIVYAKVTEATQHSVKANLVKLERK